MIKTDSSAQQCVKTGENMNKTTTSEIVAGADSQSTDGYQSTTSRENYSSIRPLTILQKIILEAEENRKRRPLISNATFAPQMNWRFLLSGYSQQIANVGGVTSTPPWVQNFKSKTTANSTSTECQPTTFGNKSVKGDQPGAASVTDCDMEFHRFDGFDLFSKTTTNEFIEQEYSPVILTHKMIRPAEKNDKLKHHRSTMIKKPKVRSPKMHYSQAVPSLNGPVVYPWLEHTRGSPQPSSKKFPTLELHGNGDGASRKDLNRFLLPERQPTTTQIENYETRQWNKEVTTSVVASYLAESRPAPSVSTIEQQATITGNETTNADRNAENMESDVEPQTKMQSLKSTTNNDNGSHEEGHTFSPQNLPECDLSNMRIPALWDHAYYKPIEATNAATPEEDSPVKFTHSPTNIGNESIEQTNTSPPESPKEFHRASKSIVATTQSYGLNETVTSGPVVSSYSHHEPTKPENVTTPQVSPVKLIHSTTSIGNESVEPSWPPESCNEFDQSNTRIPATTQSCELNEIIIPAQPPSDYFDHELTEAGNGATQRLSPVNLMHSTTNIATESIQRTNILLCQSPEEHRSNISLPAAKQSDVLNEIVSVPASSDYSNNNPNDVLKSTQQFSPAASVTPSGAALSLNQQNVVQTPKNAIKTTTSKVNLSAAKTQKRPYKRLNKIVVQSDQLIKMVPPLVGSISQTLPNSAVRINSNQIIYDQKPSNVQNTTEPIQMANMKIQVKNQVKSSAPTTATTLKRKNTDNIPVHVPSKAKFPMMKNEPKSNPTTTIATSLKRKNNEDLPLRVPAKVQKMEKPTEGTLSNMATSSISAKLPDITIERIDVAQEATKSASVISLKNRSFSDCVKFLEQNNVTVFKVPRNPQPFKGTQNLQQSNKVLDKYVKVLQQNGIRVERVSKNVNRA